MYLDAAFRRYFPAVVVAFIASAAYFQASGMMQLFGSALSVDETETSGQNPLPPRPTGAPRVDKGQVKSADAILARNPFDSVTGPLGENRAPADAPAPQDIVAGADPYQDPQCGSARVVLISASDDPEWSFAAIAGSGQKPMLRRAGDEAAGYTVYAIGRDRVWLTGNGARCQATLGVAPASGGGASAVSAGARQSDGPSRPSTGPGVLSPSDAAKITRNSDTDFTVDRSLIETVMEKQAELLGRVRVIPEKEGGQTVGLRVSGLRSGSLLNAIGLQNGDQLQRVNGFELSDPRAVMAAYPRLMTAELLTVNIVRQGKPMTIDLHIR